MHFGELGNMAHLRPGYARVLVDIIKDLGGKPFLTDANTMYVGSRKNALDHIETAYLNGFTPYTTGCHVIIADGLKGTDDVAVPVVGGTVVKEAMIGRAVVDADIVISMNHFKGHEETGFGGCLKNIGMGCGSRAGKKDQHSHGQARISEMLCRGCRKCQKECANSGLVFDESMEISAGVNYGRGSVTFIDFEDGTINNFYRQNNPGYNYIYTPLYAPKRTAGSLCK